MALLLSSMAEALRLIASADAELGRIVVLSLAISVLATLAAAVVGLPLGVALASRRSPATRLMSVLVDTGMALPPVLVGLVVLLALWRTGPLGELDLLYTPVAMVLAQFVVALPFAAGLTRSAVAALDPDIPAALAIDGAGPWVHTRELLRAARPQVSIALAAAFGRAVSEVGASLMVGGNIAGQTRVLTTAIALESGRGEFGRAIALGLVLLAVALIVNLLLAWERRRGVTTVAAG